MPPTDLSLLLVTPVVAVFALCAIATVLTFRNSGARGRSLALVPIALPLGALLPWLVFDAVYGAMDLDMGDSVAFLLVCAAAVLSLGALLAAGGVSVFLIIRYRRPRQSPSAGRSV